MQYPDPMKKKKKVKKKKKKKKIAVSKIQFENFTWRSVIYIH